MKRILHIVFCLLVLSNSVMAQGVQYFQGDVYDALLEAKKQKKLLLVECYAGWNYKSRWMNEMMNGSSKVLDFFSSNVVVWQIDTSTPGGAKFAVDYQVTDYPSIFIFNQSGVVINKIDKAMEPDEFINTIEDDIFALDGKNLWKVEQLEKFASSGDKEGADRVFTEYSQKLGKEHLMKPSNRWVFQNRTITYYYSTAFDFVLENRKEISKNPSDSIFFYGVVHDVMHDFFMESLLSSSISDTAKLQRIAQFTLTILPVDDPVNLFPAVIKSYIMKDYDLYISSLEKLISSMPEHEGPKLACTLSFISEVGTNSQKAAAKAILLQQIQMSTNSSISASLEILYNSL